MKKILRFYPIIILFVLVCALFATNYQLGTFLTGWDNLHPEFNFGVNIQRSFFAVWQEYQGLGLLGGMGHASDLLHQMVLLLLSVVMPMSFLRYFWTFLMLFIGATGAYALTNQLIVEKNGAKNKLIALIAGLFYVLNLATIQSFYTQFEVFTVHFAALPWLLLTAIQFLKYKTWKNALVVSVVLFLATPGGYVPTFFVVYLMAIGIVAVVMLWKNHNGTLPKVRHIGLLFLIIFLINGFWLLPFAYFTLTNSQTNLNAKINQMATEKIFLQNKEFGDISDVVLLKSFWFNSTEPFLRGGANYMMDAWRGYIQNPLIIGVGYVTFIFILFGVVRSFMYKKSVLAAFGVLFVFSFAMLATSTLPFSWLDTLLRDFVPLFGQVFRFPFTKFAILTSLTYAVFLAIGIDELSHVLVKRIPSFRINILMPILAIILVFVFIFPAFTGNLFYEKERLKIPQEYFDLFSFFETQDQTTRIADLPQSSFWGWNYYTWGYSGSGFLWYGIRQPILDRAFDVWSQTDEQYYYELSNAIYTKDAKAFDNVLNKYQISWLLLDKNIVSPVSAPALFTPEIKDMIAKNPRITKEKTFGNLEVYHVALADQPNKYVFATAALPASNSYTWNTQDNAYAQLGNYIASPNPATDNQNKFFPLRSLFSLKTQKEEPYQIKEDGKDIVFTQNLSYPNMTLTVPSFLEKENNIPATLVIRNDEKGGKTINIILKTPQIVVDGKKVWGQSFEQPLFVLDKDAVYPLFVNVNGGANFIVEKNSTELGTTFLPMKEDSIITVTDTKKSSKTQAISATALQTLPLFAKSNLPVKVQKSFVVVVPKVTDSYNDFTTDALSHIHEVTSCDPFRRTPGVTTGENGFLSLSTTNATACVGFYAAHLLHTSGYAIFAQAHNVKGSPLHLWIENIDEKYTPLDTFLTKNTSETASFVLPPQENFGNSYGVHFDNQSIGNEQSKNTLGKISMYPIPYNFLTSLTLENGAPATPTKSESSFAVDHPNESLYAVSNIQSLSGQTLVLSQSFNKGWSAYETSSDTFLTRAFPFIFGKGIKNHVMINNWENGWVLDNSQFSNPNSQIVIVYLPQYLEYFGFVLLIVSFSFIAAKAALSA
ncbi:MAG TPA: alpha-(1-_3)-arabinofuranosyltransferase family protein [Candidatus Saccharimonadales bacterium]|nr:alpha-(1->3)-arabinofuranosyltransferase family protein [Candidatus Saccharimonadales bacterium]